jgi:tetratricopeptide (TPR) repeat protein
LSPTGDPKTLVLANPEQRSEREKLAPAAMALQAEADKQAVEITVFNETVKRLRNVEARDSARALAEYRRFWVGRAPVPAVGVLAGIKVSQMRQRLGEIEGALSTCDTLAKKYADEPSSILLSFQKANVLMSQKRLAEASECVGKVLPELLGLGPAHYDGATTLLLKLAQANLDSEDKDGKQRARALCLDVEQIYLQWLKAGTIPHTWQMFEVLRVKYQQAGAQSQARELLPKVADALLQMTPTTKNPEGADVSLLAARWLFEHGRGDEAQALLVKESNYGNPYVTTVAVIDQADYFISRQEYERARLLLEERSVKAKPTQNLVLLICHC